MSRHILSGWNCCLKVLNDRFPHHNYYLYLLLYNYALFCSCIPILFVHFVKSFSSLCVVIADHLDSLIIIVCLCAVSEWLIVSFYFGAHQHDVIMQINA